MPKGPWFLNTLEYKNGVVSLEARRYLEEQAARAARRGKRRAQFTDARGNATASGRAFLDGLAQHWKNRNAEPTTAEVEVIADAAEAKAGTSAEPLADPAPMTKPDGSDGAGSRWRPGGLPWRRGR